MTIIDSQLDSTASQGDAVVEVQRGVDRALRHHGRRAGGRWSAPEVLGWAFFSERFPIGDFGR